MKLYHKASIKKVHTLFTEYDSDSDRPLCCSTDQCPSLINGRDVVVCFQNKQYTGEYKTTDIDGGWGEWDEMRPDNLDFTADFSHIILSPRIYDAIRYVCDNFIDLSSLSFEEIEESFPEEVYNTLYWMYQERDMDLDDVQWFIENVLYDEAGTEFFQEASDEELEFLNF